MPEAGEISPAVTDVPVNPDAPHVPQPSSGLTPQRELEPQEVEKEQPKEEEKKKSASIDDAVKKAFEKSQKQQGEKAEKPAKADEEAKAKAEDEPKAKEAEKPATERRPDGKFAPKAQEGAEEASQQPQQPAKPSSYSEAPSRFHEAARAEWANAPESVRGEIHRAVSELEKGIEKYRASHEEYEGLREYRDMAKQHGTDIKTALQNYVGIENKLRQNPVQGLEQIVQNLGLKKQDGSPVTLFDVAHSIVNQNPDQRAAQQNSTISQLQGEVKRLTDMMAQTHSFMEQQRKAPVETAIREFASKPEHSRYHELEDQMTTLITSGVVPQSLSLSEKLDRAYKIAVFNADGEFPSAQTAPKPEAPNGAHTAPPVASPPPSKPAGQKSVTGTPSAMPNGQGQRKGPAPSIDEALERAMRKAS